MSDFALKGDFRKDIELHYAGVLRTLGYDVDADLKRAVLKDPKLRAWQWMASKYVNVRKRKITAAPRAVIRSTQLQQRELSSEQTAALSRITADSIAGIDLSQYLSKSISRLTFNDAMLNEWRIHHLHLGSPTTTVGGFAGRENDVLFVMVTDECIYFIEIFPHGEWENGEVVEILHSNWPAVIEPRRSRDILGLENPHQTQEERKLLRKHNMNSAYQTLDGAVYFLSPGFVMSGASAEPVMYSLRITHTARDAWEHSEAHSETFRKKVQDNLGHEIDVLELRMKLYDEDHRYELIAIATDQVLATGQLPPH